MRANECEVHITEMKEWINRRRPYTFEHHLVYIECTGSCRKHLICIRREIASEIWTIKIIAITLSCQPGYTILPALLPYNPASDVIF